MKKSNDTYITNEIRKGNKDVFKIAFDRYYYLLRDFANKYVYEYDVVEDMVQDVFISLWENENTKQIQSLKAYLYTATRNKCLDYLKHHKVRDKNQIFLVEAYLETFEEKEDHDELFNKIIKLLLTFPNNMREIFERKYLSGMTASEIAKEMNISTSTVNTQLQRAKAKIRENLKEDSIALLILLHHL